MAKKRPRQGGDDLGHEPENTRDREFAPMLKDDDEPQASDRTREHGRKATGTGVPTSLPSNGESTARSSDEGPSIGVRYTDEPEP
ncbi:MAG: hypothetical protein M0026_05445 [Nocardiopsaceae bacterium]|nr:hypothetical protein [Nocardiopsaceae bacterium]